MKLILILICCISPSFLGFSQSQKTDQYIKLITDAGEVALGFLVTNENDTIKGLFVIKDLELSCYQAYLYDPKTKKVVKYKPKHAKYYKRGEEEFFSRKIERGSSITSHGKSKFMKSIESGDYNLYRFCFSQTSGGYPNGPFMITHKQDYYLERKGKFIRVKHLGFKYQMSKLVSNNKELSSKILNKDYKFRDLLEIIKIYNEQSSLKFK